MQAKYMYFPASTRINIKLFSKINLLSVYKILKIIVLSIQNIFFRKPRMIRQVGQNSWEEVPRYEFVSSKIM